MIARRATLADLPDILRMGAAFHAASPVHQSIPFASDSLQQFCEQAFDNTEVGFWVAADGDRIAGMAAAVIFPSYFNHTATIVQELFWWVDSDARGTGAGKQLIESIEQWAADLDAKAVFMIALADKNEEKMQNVYARRGYRPLERTFIREVM